MLILGLPQCLLGALLLFTGQGALSRLVAGVLFLDVVLHRLPWRPREDRTAFGYWVEALTYTLPLTAVAIAWVVLDPAAHEAGPLAWFAAAPLVAGVIIRLSGVNLTALRSGDLAFLAGPLPLHRVTARGLAVIVSPLFEEVLFRGIPATLPRLQAVGLLLGGAAFVAHHHLGRGDDPATLPAVRIELIAAVLLGGLVVASGSVWPAVAAHLLANVPHLVLDVQRLRTPADDDESDVMT
jgi:membrane protease YdiL (CAAX protease family)